MKTEKFVSLDDYLTISHDNCRLQNTVDAQRSVIQGYQNSVDTFKEQIVQLDRIVANLTAQNAKLENEKIVLEDYRRRYQEAFHLALHEMRIMRDAEYLGDPDQF